jgi:hypothetical protein
MAKDCSAGLTPASLEWCDGQIQTPGIRGKVYFSPKRNIVTFPTRRDASDDDVDASKLSILVGNFVLAAGKFWKEIDVLTDKSPITAESQGSKPSRTSLNKGTFFYPGTEEEAASFAVLAQNSDYVYLIQQRNGKFRVIGNDMYQTDTKVSQTLGDNATSEMGTKIEVECTDVCPAPFYEGQIVTADGVINEDAQASIALTTAAATAAQSVAVNTAIAAIGYAYTGNAGAIQWTAAAPAGITVDTALDGSIIISGTPTAAGVYTYTIAVTGVPAGVTAEATGTITVTA